LNSYVSDIHVIGQDSQAIGSLMARDFQTVQQLPGGFDGNVLFGGADPKDSRTWCLQLEGAKQLYVQARFPGWPRSGYAGNFLVGEETSN